MSRAAAPATPATPPALRRRPAPARAPRPAVAREMRPPALVPAPASAPRPRRSPSSAPAPRQRRFPFFVFAALVIGALAVAVVSMQALVSQTSFQMQDLQGRTQQLEQSYGQLKLSVAQLSSPERVAAAAARMGLGLPSRVETLSVRGLPGGHSGSGRRGGGVAFSLKSVLGEHP